MAHILVGGDSGAVASIRSLLTQWGMTSGAWCREGSATGLPTIDECDAVILTAPFPAVLDADGGAPDGAPRTPLLLLGDHPGHLLLARDAQQVVSHPGPAGLDLKSALLACLEQTRHLRGLQGNDWQGTDREGYLHFLGHELRSPLTAAKTALEVLQGELGGMTPQGATACPADGLKMLDIALRNIKRLHRTVDWSQDLLELETAAPRSRWTLMSVDRLAGVVEEAAHLTLDPDVSGQRLETDPNLLRVLVGQMIRVFQYAQPDCPLAGEVRLDPTRNRGLKLVLHAAGAGGGPEVARIARTCLIPVAGAGECSARQELELLVSYVVSRPLLAQLQAAVEVGQDDAGGPCLVLRLVLAEVDQGCGSAADRSGELLPAALHAPA